jgi:hypothetical protein
MIALAINCREFWFPATRGRNHGNDIAPPLGRGHNIGMARLRRRWRVVKWAGLAFSLLIFFAWGASYSPLVLADGTCILADGRLYQRFAQDNSGCTVMDRRSRFPAIDMSIDLLPILLLMIGSTTILFWLDRRRIPPHCCQGCGYDLTGNVSGVCPECGRRA